MKKLFIGIFVFNIILLIFGITVKMNLNNNSSKEYDLKYETWGSELSVEELNDYYLENNIAPAKYPDGANEKDGMFDENGVAEHLHNRFSDYVWSKSNNVRSVSDVYGNNPVGIMEDDDYLQKAKNLAGITYNALGCGPIAIVGQMEYLARNAKYISISSNIESEDDCSSKAYGRIALAREVLENTATIPADGDLGQFFHVDPNKGTFTFPSSVVNSCRSILENHSLSIKKERIIIDDEGNEEKTSYYDTDSLIIVNGDLIPNFSSFSMKINNLIDSIDRGMPIIWWTMSNAGRFEGHYMNIFGYEYWTGIDGDGNTETHLMFKLNCNWKHSYEYMDSDMLQAVNGGFIFFEETRNREVILPADYAYECRYDSYSQQKNVVPTLGAPILTEYLRCGYVNKYDSSNINVIGQYITLSAKKQGAGEAYLGYHFNKAIEIVYFEMGWWSSQEGIGSGTGSILLQYKDLNGNWITQINFLLDAHYILSTNINVLTKVVVQFDQPTTDYRILVLSNNPTGNKNKGRVVIGSMMAVVYDEK